MLECLEDRLAPAVIRVTSLADNLKLDGRVTLREAIAQGPIGRLFAWLDARAEAREERELRETSTPVRFSPRHETRATDRDDLAA